MYQYSNSLIRQFPSSVTGNAAVGIQATVYVGNTGALASLFESNGTTPKSNPVTTDSKGFYSFSVADGDYRISFSNSQFPDLPFTVLDGAAIREEFDALVASNTAFRNEQQAAYDAFVLSQGWDQVGTFATGFTYTSPNQVGQDADGNWWRWNGAFNKVVTAGTLPSSDANYKLVGDGVLRSDLASSSSDVLVGGVDAGTYEIQVSSVQTLLNAPLVDGRTYSVKAYHQNWPSYYKEPDGGGTFTYVASKPKSEHDGGIVIDPLKVFPTDWTNETKKTTWFTPSVSGIGCFVRNNVDVIDPLLYGAPEIDLNANSTKSVQQAINACEARGWPEMRCKYLYAIFSNLIVDRPIGAGEPNAYWNVTSDERGGLVCRFAGALFSTSIEQAGDDPVCQLIRFKGAQLSGDGNGTDRFILDGNKFLRVSFDQFTATFIRCLNTTGNKYVQSIYFNSGNIRKCTGTFFNADIGYDVKISSGTLMEAHGGDAFRIKTPIGCSLIGSNLEGISGTAFDYERAQGLAFLGMYWEGNGRDIDGSNMDASVSYGVANIGGYHSVSDLGYSVKWGPTFGGISAGNWATGDMHEFTDQPTSQITLIQDVAQDVLTNEFAVNSGGVYSEAGTPLTIRTSGSASYTTVTTYSNYTLRDGYVNFDFVATVTSTATNTAGNIFISAGLPFAAAAIDLFGGNVAIQGEGSSAVRVSSVTPTRVESYDAIMPALNNGETATISGSLRYKI